MHDFRKKQKRTKKLLNALLIFTAVYIFAFIGVEPYIRESLGSSLAFNYIAQILIVASLVFLFIYYSKFSKADKYLENAEYIINDAGYYITSREEKELKSYHKALVDDLNECSFNCSGPDEINELIFDTVAYKGKQYFYISVMDEVEDYDVIAYLDSAIYDATALKLKRKGNGVMCFLCNSVSDKAISYSKDITELGRKAQLKFAVAICDVKTSRVYFLGNKPSVCEAMIKNHIMNCEIPLKEKYIGKDKLSFQKELENKLSDFDIKSFKEGKYNR